MKWRRFSDTTNGLSSLLLLLLLATLLCLVQSRRPDDAAKPRIGRRSSVTATATKAWVTTSIGTNVGGSSSRRGRIRLQHDKHQRGSSTATTSTAVCFSSSYSTGSSRHVGRRWPLLHDGHNRFRTLQSTRLLVQQGEDSNHGVSSSDDISSSSSSLSWLSEILYEYGYGSRLLTLSEQNLPVLAEVHMQGESVLALVSRFVPTTKVNDTNKDDSRSNSSSTKSDTRNPPIPSPPPRAQVLLLEKNETVLVDVGQITTIWTPRGGSASSSALDQRHPWRVLQKLLGRSNNQKLQQQAASRLQGDNDAVLDQVLDRIYARRVHLAATRQQPQRQKSPLRSKAKLRTTTTSALTKKQITQLVENLRGSQENNDKNGDKVEMLQQVLRHVQKSGPAYSRLVDSVMLRDYLYDNGNSNHDSKSTNSDDGKDDSIKAQLQQAVACYILSRDASQGGRFKRWPCTLISHHDDGGSGGNRDTNDHQSHTVTTIINGGWIVLDKSSRAGAEARKFAERFAIEQQQPRQQQHGGGSDEKGTTTNLSSRKPKKAMATTAADERIIRRLECLAMGEIFRRGGDDNGDVNDKDNVDTKLELDVRGALTAMELEVSPAGAKQALIQIGRWSAAGGYSDKENSSYIQPWSKDVLQAAAWYAQQRQQQQQEEPSTLLDRVKRNERNSRGAVVDLTSLPCVAVDAKTTRFRDDAIGVRPRASTGRSINPEASKWEILIHICDVSDIYANQLMAAEEEEDTNKNDGDGAQNNLLVLRKAAQGRGMSRYDLPLGPLHLLPPVALEALALKTNYASVSSATAATAAGAAITNRCVTLWAFIDERDGRLLDSGVERTAVSPPLTLSYNQASDLMDASGSIKAGASAHDERAKAILLVAERNILLWSQNRQRNSDAARKKEARRVEKALEAQHHQRLPFASDEREIILGHDGRGFQRTRAHQVVDASLDLYAFGVTRLLRKARAPIPMQPGADLSSGGRVATGPLRRYIDGEAQRQILAVLCHYGRVMTLEECKEVAEVANDARNALSNIRAVRDTRR